MLPDGSIEADDPDREAAARRELAEETGYEGGAVEHLTTVEPANGFADSLFHYFVARDCEQTAGQDLDDNETIRVATTSWTPSTRTSSGTAGARWPCCTTSPSSGRSIRGPTG